MQEKDNPLEIVNGPTQEKINEWKVKFGDIFVTSLGNDKYIYRPLKRFEYKQILQTAQNPENKAFAEEKVAEKCIIWPKLDAAKFSMLKAGTISTLVDLVMVASDFGVSEEPRKL